MTLEAFLEWESRRDRKYEFEGFRPVAMTGGTAEHSQIQFNLLGLLFNLLRGHRCRGHGSELKIQVAGRIRYPMLSLSALPFHLAPRLSSIPS